MENKKWLIATAKVNEAERAPKKKRIQKAPGPRKISLKRRSPGRVQARNKYTYFASVAKKEGYEQICVAFP